MTHLKLVRVACGFDELGIDSFAIVVPEGLGSHFTKFLDHTGVSHGGKRLEMIDDTHFENWYFFPDRNKIEAEQVVVAFVEQLLG